jgi:hypothetical protein
VRIDAVPTTPSLLAAATSVSVIVPSAIFAEVIAPVATAGAAAVPVRSPASWTTPLVELVASGGVPPDALIHADPL